MPLTSPERRRLCHINYTREPSPVAAWVASLPLGTTGTARDLLPSLLASPEGYRVAQRTPIALGLAMSRLEAYGVTGRPARGTMTWTVAAAPARPLALPTA